MLDRATVVPMRLWLCVLLLSAPYWAWGQSRPTARQTLQISAFAGATGVYTGLDGGKNLSIGAGLDVGFRRFFGVDPAIEVRGLYPVKKGGIDSQESLLLGLQAGRHFGVFHPYVDFLFGRGQIDYDPARPNPSGTIYYQVTTSNVFSPGVGVDLDITRRFGVRADAQYQRWATPVTASGSLYAKPITFALIYHLDFNRTARLPNR